MKNIFSVNDSINIGQIYTRKQNVNTEALVLTLHFLLRTANSLFVSSHGYYLYSDFLPHMPVTHLMLSFLHHSQTLIPSLVSHFTSSARVWLLPSKPPVYHVLATAEIASLSLCTSTAFF